MARHFTICVYVCISLFSGVQTAFAQENNTNTQSNVVNVETTITAVSTADLEIAEERVCKSTTWTMNFITGNTLEQRKANLIVELCREVGADVLVDPQFTYKKRFLGSGKLTVSGYPAKYKNFRTMSDSEIDAFIATPEYNTGKVVFINK